jgi:hypothetical protein
MTNVLDTLFGGNVPGGLLTPQGIQRARQQGLLNAGIATLAASENHGLGGSLAAGLQAGQTAYTENAAGQAAQAQQEQRQRMLDAAGISASDSSEQAAAKLRMILFQLIRGGDHAGATAVSEVLKSMNNAAENRVTYGAPITVTGPDGKPTLVRPGSDGSMQPVVGYTPKADTPSRGARRLVAVQTPTGPRYQWADPNTGAFEDTGMSPGTGQTASDGERRAALVYQSMQYAMPILDAADAPSRLEQLSTMGGDKALNEMLTADQQKRWIAGLVVSEAWLRVTSGAAITKEEIENAARSITPMPGDKLETLLFKRGLRQQYKQAIQAYSARARRAEAALPPEPASSAPTPGAATAPITPADRAKLDSIAAGMRGP